MEGNKRNSNYKRNRKPLTVAERLYIRKYIYVDMGKQNMGHWEKNHCIRTTSKSEKVGKTESSTCTHVSRMKQSIPAYIYTYILNL